MLMKARPFGAVEGRPEYLSLEGADVLLGVEITVEGLGLFPFKPEVEPLHSWDLSQSRPDRIYLNSHSSQGVDHRALRHPATAANEQNASSHRKPKDAESLLVPAPVSESAIQGCVASLSSNGIGCEPPLL